VVVLDVPAAAIRVGQRFELGAHVIGATPSTIVGARFAVIDTRSTTPSFVAATSPAPGSFRAVAAVAREGTYDISFEARAGDVPLRSVRSVRVTR
jgi:hypothetical protein